MMRVAVTRALPEAQASAERVRARGVEPVLAPLLRIAPAAFDARLEGAQALLFTSANGVRAFAAASAERGSRVLAVGDATAAAARRAGFSNVASADGDVAKLAQLAREQLDPAGGALVHVGGAHLAGDLAGALAAAGFKTERRIAYEAVPVERLPEAFSTALDAVLFYSVRAGETYLAFGAAGASELVAACLSPAVAHSVAAAKWRRLIVAPAPREEALLSALLEG